MKVCDVGNIRGNTRNLKYKNFDKPDEFQNNLNETTFTKSFTCSMHIIQRSIYPYLPELPRNDPCQTPDDLSLLVYAQLGLCAHGNVFVYIVSSIK